MTALQSLEGSTTFTSFFDAHGPLRLLAVAVGTLLCLSLPFWSPSNYVTNIAILALFFTVASAGLNVIYGYAGLLSFAQVGFWGLGAYVSAILIVDVGLSPWLSFVVGGLAAVAVALLVGIPALRVSRDAFVIVTLSFSLLLQLLARNWISITRGPMGIPGLPSPGIDLGLLGRFDGTNPAHFYWIALGFAIVMLAGLYRLVRSRIGRVLLAINLDEALARSQGVNVVRYQLLAFAASALVAGMAGGLYVEHLTIVDPTIFDVYYTQMMLIIVIIGGPGHFWPVIAAGVIFTGLPELLRLTPELRMVLFGVVLVVAIQFFPQGFGGHLAARRMRAWRSASQ